MVREKRTLQHAQVAALPYDLAREWARAMGVGAAATVGATRDRIDRWFVENQSEVFVLPESY
jgi:hypothetical protein